MDHKPLQNFPFRSLFWTMVLVPFLFLPYRWLWLPCGLGGLTLVWPGRTDARNAFRSDGTLIAGSVVVLLVRTFLDVGWWMPWLAVMCGLIAARRQRWWSVRVATLAVPITILLAVSFLWRPMCLSSRSPDSSLPHPDMVVVCAGDSLTSGVRPGTDAGTYVARLREKLGCRVINAGVANDRTADLLTRLDKTVLGHHPDVVLVFIGGNDYLDDTPRARFAEQFDRLVARVSASGAHIVIVEVPSGIIWNPYAGIYRRTAARYNAVFVPESQLRWWYSVELLFRDRLKDPLTIDGIHLSTTGAARVADWLSPYVIQATRLPIKTLN